MRYPPRILDEIRARLPVSAVVGRRVALKRAGREMRGLSPFKDERTPSFFVNDQKAFYHCFASGEHGDIFTFLMKTEGLSFPEAVERLASEAGVQLPKPEAADVQREDDRARLHALMEAAARFYEVAFSGSEGGEARRYAEKRGLSHEAIHTFRLGFAPASRTALKNHLAKAGFSVPEMLRTGMLIKPEDGGEPYDRFRARLMFPIQDLRGKLIAFGGRAFDPKAPAKYLNSPETELFHKGHVLFNAAHARKAAFDRKRVIAVEGYMDVVALWEAGFHEAVAPLGTALTAEQVALLWRLADEPILCFDGDAAGRKAAFRAVDTVLPLITAGHSVRFAFLSDGLDPDDLVRQQGPEAFEAVLGRLSSLSEVLWEREWGDGAWTTPERRARLEQQLRAHVARIGDGAVRAHYAEDVSARLAKAWGARAPQSRRAPQGGPQAGWRPRADGQRHGAMRGLARRGEGGPRPGGFAAALKASAGASLKQSRVVSGGAAAASYREALLLRTLINHPWLIEPYAERIAALSFANPLLSRLRDQVLAAHASINALDSLSLRTHVTRSGADKALDLVERAITHRSDKFAEPEADRATVETGWLLAMALHDRDGLLRELNEAESSWKAEESAEALARITEIKRQLAMANADIGTTGSNDGPL